MQHNAHAPEEMISTPQLFWKFFRIGCVAWGGFMALVSIVRLEIVERHRLVDDEDFLNGISLAVLLPGPVAMNAVAFVGDKIAGRKGAWVATIAVTLPSFLLVLLFSVFFFSYGQIPAVERFFTGILPAIAAIVLHAALQMRSKALKRVDDWIIAGVAACLLLGIGGIYTIFTAILGAAVYGVVRGQWPLVSDEMTERQPSCTSATQPPAAVSIGTYFSIIFLTVCLVLYLLPHGVFEATPVWQLFATLSGMSITLFGGGFVFIPLMSEVIVDNLGWLSPSEFSAAIAIGQVTPGPILISATFIGYKVAGFPGAVVATIGMFLPPAVLMLTAARFLNQFKDVVWVEDALAGIRAVVLGLIASSAMVILLSIDVSQGVGVLTTNMLVFIGVLTALLRFNVSVLLLLSASGIMGLITF